MRRKRRCGRSIGKVEVDGWKHSGWRRKKGGDGLFGQQGALSGPKRQKKMTRRMGKLEKTRKGRLGKDCEEWDTYDSLQGDSIPWESGCGH